MKQIGTISNNIQSNVDMSPNKSMMIQYSNLDSNLKLFSDPWAQTCRFGNKPAN